MDHNLLYYGDNLEILRRYVKDESVDLVYLDPPFNSNASYNVLFAERNGTQAAAQIKAFEDTWRWDEAAARAYEEVVEGGGKVSEVMRAFRTFLGGNDMLAYRRRFGREMAFGGGIDKRALAAGGAALQSEVLRVGPLIRDGGYVPGCDHGVPPDVSLSSFVEYTRLLAALTGWC